jgi:hypothetical protein
MRPDYRALPCWEVTMQHRGYLGDIMLRWLVLLPGTDSALHYCRQKLEQCENNIRPLFPSSFITKPWPMCRHDTCRKLVAPTN